MSTVTVGCVASAEYAEHLPDWLDAIRQLERQPDEVVVATRSDWLPSWVRTIDHPDGVFDFRTWHATLLDAVTTDWCVWLGVDDLCKPWALNDWPDWDDVDVAIFGNQLWRGNDDVESLLRIEYNHVTCGSPIRMDAYRRSPGLPETKPYEDWGLWVGMAKTGARFRRTGRVDYLYRVHDSTITAVEPTRSRIREWAATL